MAKWFHRDHDLTEHALDRAEDALTDALSGAPDGEVRVAVFTLDADEPGIPCGLHGPAMGDTPVRDFEVQMVARGTRPWPSRMLHCGALPRTVWFGAVVGRSHNGSVEVFTAYGGPIAPREPQDPSMTDEAERAYSRAFWAVHALTR